MSEILSNFMLKHPFRIDGREGHDDLGAGLHVRFQNFSCAARSACFLRLPVLDERDSEVFSFAYCIQHVASLNPPVAT